VKIHTDKITYPDLHSALTTTTTGVWLDRADLKGSRSRQRAWDVALESDGTPDKNGKPRRRTRNVGTSRRSYEHPGFAASYDDWGWWLAALFEIDPEAIAGPYKGYEDFHLQTKGDYLSRRPRRRSSLT
jgi:hypothetical protein